MELAPKDGTKILVKILFDGHTMYKVCKWIDNFSIVSDGGAWQYTDKFSVSHAMNEWCLGWVYLD